MSPVRRLLVPLVLPAVLVATAACGGGSSGPSQEAYAARAGQVCAEAKDRIDELYMEQAVEEMRAAAGGEAPVYVERPERWVRAKIVPAYQGLSGNLKGIPAPDGDVAYLTDLYGDLDARIEVLHRRPSDGRAVIEADQQLRDRFTSYGIEGCPPEPEEAPDYEDPAKVMMALAEQDEAEAAPGGE